MINDLSNSLADRIVNLSPEVRAFCEENSRKIAGEPPRFQTMSDAWVFLVLEGLKTQTKFEGELKKTKDAFRWRLVNSDFRGILLLAVIQELEYRAGRRTEPFMKFLSATLTAVFKI